MANNATWTPRPSLNVARGGFASATAGGRIHVIGGSAAASQQRSAVSRPTSLGTTLGSWRPRC
jgi:hypothetical protein